MSEGTESPQPTGNAPSPRRLSGALLGLLHGHVELFGIELHEQKANTVKLLLFAGLTLIFTLLLLIGVCALLLMLAWDSWRLEALGGLCLVFAAATVCCGLRLRASLDDDSSPFSATLEELKNDRERLLP